MYFARYVRQGTAEHLKRVFAEAKAVEPCRHCQSIRPCSCGKADVDAVLALAKSMLPQLRVGEQRINHAGIANAIEDVERNWRAMDLRTLERRAAACARTARADKNEPQAAAFDHLVQAAGHAAEALPR